MLKMKKIKDNLLGDKQIFVFNVYVGNIDDADVEQYVNSVADRFQ